MRRIMQIISWLSLAGTIVPSILFYLGKMELEALKTTMLVATVTWFVATAMWMGRSSAVVHEEVIP